MTNDLGQLFKLRKTATADPPETSGATASADEATEEAGGGPDRLAPVEAAGPRRDTAAEPSTPKTRPRTPNAATAKAAPKRAPKQAPAPPPEEPTAAPREPADGTASVTLTATSAGEGNPRSATSSGGRASIMLYTTQTVRERMKEEAQRTSLSYGQLTLLCVENTLDRLEQVFAARAGATSQLFSTDYKPRSRTGETRSANLNLHIARRDLDVVQSLWEQFPGCRSRNDLLSTACALHLTGESDA